jgi:fructose-1,6-bisphosphatase/inositol monophosphatase family enzyme/phosphoglycerate dehydrogenase-like enzyme
MRLLLAGCPDLGTITLLEIDTYLARGYDVVANTFFYSIETKTVLINRYKSNNRISFELFDPCDSQAFLSVFQSNDLGFDAIICWPNIDSLTPNTIAQIAEMATMRHKLRAICSPNDSVNHLRLILEIASHYEIAILHTVGVHANAVAEYTIAQIGGFSRRLEYLNKQTGNQGAWPHYEAITSTHLISGRCLGVIGGSGKDGNAVITLAIKHGLRVVATCTGTPTGMQRIRDLGAVPKSDIEELLECADYVSVNCRLTDGTRGLIGEREIAKMKPGVLIVNPSGAEIIDKTAIIAELSRPHPNRLVGGLILDMPYGEQRNDEAFLADPDNAILKRLGVVFTPRSAGYTLESQCQALLKLADNVDRYLCGRDEGVPIANRLPRCSVPQENLDHRADRLLNDLIILVKEAGEVAIKLRINGVQTQYNDDGSPSTNADLVCEKMIQDGLIARGHSVFFWGEETGTVSVPNGAREVIVDGIDGTRNYRDGNYGWCISVASRKYGVVDFAVVHDPYCRETYYAKKGMGAFMRCGERETNLRIPLTLPQDFSFSVGSFRVRGSSVIKSLIIEDIKMLGGRGREWGSVALSICAVARGGLGVFIQGNSNEHDYVAGLLIASEAGACVSGSRVDSGSLADIIVAHPSIAERVSQIFDERTKTEPESAK